MLAKLKLASHGVTEEQLVSAAWPMAVGKTIANRTSVIALVRTRLVVQVEDQIWQRQLFALKGQIVHTLGKALGKQIVDELEFRVVVPQRKPAQSEALIQSEDDADGIRDTSLRSVYKTARRKATA